MNEILAKRQSIVRSFVRRLFFECPSAVKESAYPTYVPINFGAIVCAVDHFGWLIIFYLLDVTSLSLFNILSVSMWVSAVVLNRKGYHYTALTIGCIELLLHQALCVIIIGWGTGFQYFILIVPIAVLILSENTVLFQLFSVLISFGEFALLDFLYRNEQPQIVLDILTTNILNYANIGILFCVFPIIMFYSSSKMREARRQLRDRNQALANIEKNLKKYLPIQLVDKIKSGKKDATIETERRKLTVFFSDIKGFTEVTESLEAEELSSLLNEYLTEMTQIAHKWGGTVDKFIGDAIMIFFGAPERTPDMQNAINCVKMAIEMQEKMKALQNKWFNEGFENPLHIRIGISTGTSTVGNFGAEDRLSYTVIGSQVNIASRLEGICKPDEIMISHPTWAYVKDEIRCTPGEKVAVKGIPREIMTYRVVVN